MKTYQHRSIGSDTVKGVTQRLAGAASAPLPNFIVIGAMKAGTTSLYQYLKHHDQVFMPPIKELDFFVAESNWCRGVGWYRHRFRDAGEAPARGEASVAYTQYPAHAGVPERMARVLPDVRLVYVVRDPIARIRSHYQHLVLTGVEKCPPEVAIFENPVYLDCSKYAMQLEQYLEHFPRRQIMVVTSEALRFDRVATVQEVCRFLGVDPTRLPDVIGTEFYRTAQRPSYPPLVLWARRVATRHQVQADLARRFAERMLARQTPGGDPGACCGGWSEGSDGGQALSPQLRARLTDLLHEDVARFCRYMPADFDGWGYV